MPQRQRLGKQAAVGETVEVNRAAAERVDERGNICDVGIEGDPGERRGAIGAAPAMEIDVEDLVVPRQLAEGRVEDHVRAGRSQAGQQQHRIAGALALHPELAAAGGYL